MNNQKQLHRHNWMPLQGKSYQESHDEKYMLSWKEVYTDWIAKHPLPKVALTSSNGINFKYPHVLWDKRRLFRNYFKSSSLNFYIGMAFFFLVYILRSMPIIYLNTNMPVEIISC